MTIATSISIFPMSFYYKYSEHNTDSKYFNFIVHPINTIKYNPNVWTKLNESKIYMYPAKFDRQYTACPGYLINIHPT